MTEIDIDNPADFPESSAIEKVEEPFVKAEIMVPNDFVGRSWSYVSENVAILSR